MQQWTAQKKINAGFLVLSILPILLTVLAWNSSRSLIAAGRRLEQTNDVVLETEHLLSRVKDIEVAQREFILTGEEKSLAPYHAARQNLMREIRSIATPHNKMWISHLETLVPEKFEEMDKTIDLRRKHGMEAASQMIMYAGLPPAMEGIRTVFRRMIDEEKKHLEDRNAELQRNLRWTLILFGTVLVLNIGFVWGIALIMRREDRSIRQLNVELEQRVAQRTEALQRSNDDLAQFAYVASHDLREPLRVVASYTTLLQRKYRSQLDAEADQFIDFIVDGVKRMQALIQDLLDYSRVAESNEENPQPVDTEVILQNVLTNLQVSITESGAKITWDRLPSVPMDPMRLTQVLQNLIANAIKYRSSRQPQIHIRAVSDRWETRFSVSDNGIGIDPKYTNSIFGIFKRLHGKEYEGTGIGLAMCKKIVERTGGRIWVESQPGEGSTFFFTVPKQRQLAATAS